jgi:hypothetical protein
MNHLIARQDCLDHTKNYAIVFIHKKPDDFERPSQSNQSTNKNIGTSYITDNIKLITKVRPCVEEMYSIYELIAAFLVENNDHTLWWSTPEERE